MSATTVFGTRQCDGKRSYVNKQEAKASARVQNARFGGVPVRPYRCEICEKFHIGQAAMAAAGRRRPMMRLFQRHQVTEAPVVLCTEARREDQIKPLERAIDRVVAQLTNPNLVADRPRVEARLVRLRAELEELKEGASL